MTDRNTSWLHVEYAKGDRQAEAARADGTWVEQCDPLIASDKRHVRVPADHQVSPFRLRELAYCLVEARPLQGDMDQQDRQGAVTGASQGQRYPVR